MSRYHPERTTNRVKGIAADDYGGFPNDGKPFSPEEDDRLFEGFLVKRLRGYCDGDDTWQAQFGRSWDGCNTRMRKLCFRYPGAAHYAPQPGGRTDRTGRGWTDEDKLLLGYCLSLKAKDRGGWDVAHIARVLGRGESEVRGHLRRTGDGLPQGARSRSFLDEADRPDYNDEELTERAARKLGVA